MYQQGQKIIKTTHNLLRVREINKLWSFLYGEYEHKKLHNQVSERIILLNLMSPSRLVDCSSCQILVVQILAKGVANKLTKGPFTGLLNVCMALCFPLIYSVSWKFLRVFNLQSNLLPVKPGFRPTCVKSKITPASLYKEY